MDPTLVSQSDITAWASKEEAKSILPALVRRLINNSKGISIQKIHFPAYEETVLGGFDGELTSTGEHPYVPSGDTVFELSVRSDSTTKANQDYEKRKDDPGKYKPSDTTYVQLTPRRWATKENWQTEKSKEKVWKEVRAYDITDIYTWLEQDPLTHRWLTEQISGNSAKAISATTHWQHWSKKTDPALNPKLLLAGRSGQAMKMLESLKTGKGNVLIKAASANEGILFSIATLLELNDTQLNIDSAVVVFDESGLTQLLNAQKPLVIIDGFGSSLVENAVAKGHRVITVLAPQRAGDANTIKLIKINSSEAQSVLEADGIDLSKTHKLGELISRSFFAYLRTTSINPALLKPDWLSNENLTTLTTASLLGSWSDNSPADRKLIEKLSGKTYAEYEQLLTQFELYGDNPVVHKGDVWSVVDKQDLIVMVKDSYTKTQLTDFFETTKGVLTTPEPKYDLIPSEWFMANVLDKIPVYSTHLSNSIPSTLAILASKYGTEKLGGITYDLQDNANIIVKDVLEKANSDNTGKLWLTLSNKLPALAEASPDQFIELLEKDLESATPTVEGLFVEDDSFFAATPFTSLIDALEKLSWKKELSANVLLLLTELDKFSKKDNVHPNPLGALYEILSPFNRRSVLTDAEKVESLEMITRNNPLVGKKLLFRLIPEHWGTRGGVRDTDFREWSSEVTESTLTYGELHSLIKEIVTLLLPILDSVGDYEKIIEKITDLPFASFDLVVSFVESLNSTVTDFTERERIWNQINEVISHHRQFPGAQWSYDEEKLKELERIALLFKPESAITQAAVLFDYRPKILNPSGKGYKEDQEIISQEQQNAARKIFEEQGFKGIEDLAKLAKVPGFIGKSLADNEAGEDINPDIFNLFNRQEQRIVDVAHSYFYNRSQKIGNTKALEYLVSQSGHASQTTQVSALLALTIDSDVIKYLKSQNEEYQKEYWEKRSPLGLGELEDPSLLAAEFLKFGHTLKAIDLIGIYSHRPSKEFPPELILEALTRALTAKYNASEIDTQMFPYNIVEMFKSLDKSETDIETVSQLELAWFPLIKRDRHTLALHSKLATSPEYFVELLELAYKKHSEEKKKITKAQEDKAYQAHEILDSWRKLPGTNTDGTIDYAAFKTWADKVRELAKASDRLEMADNHIGGVLIKSLPLDGEWPPDEIAAFLDEIKSDSIVSGMLTTSFNTGAFIDRTESEKRTVKEEDYLTQQAERLQRRFPYTSRILRKLAEQAGRKHKFLFRGEE